MHLSELVNEGMAYVDFMAAVTRAGKLTATIVKQNKSAKAGSNSIERSSPQSLSSAMKYCTKNDNCRMAMLNMPQFKQSSVNLTNESKRRYRWPKQCGTLISVSIFMI